MAMLVYQRVGVKLFSDSTVVRLMCGKHILILYCANPVLTAAQATHLDNHHGGHLRLVA